MIFRCRIYERERERAGETYRYAFMPLYGLINTLHLEQFFLRAIRALFWANDKCHVSFLYNASCNCISANRRTITYAGLYSGAIVFRTNDISCFMRMYDYAGTAYVIAPATLFKFRDSVKDVRDTRRIKIILGLVNVKEYT